MPSVAAAGQAEAKEKEEEKEGKESVTGREQVAILFPWAPVQLTPSLGFCKLHI